MSGRDSDCGVDQLVREDGGDLRGHRIGGVRQVGPDEYLEMPVAAAPIIPALADRAALRAPAGEADRDAHSGGRGGGEGAAGICRGGAGALSEAREPRPG